jgi:tRNA nucleotidyltransferase (CCA-adding enzyme)
MKGLRPTRSVLDIASRLEAAGFEAWCVGGAIRDALLGGHPLDWDLATQAHPEQVRELFGRRRTIPVGIEFGTVSVLDDEGVAHEITTFRRDVKTDGRHAEVEFGASLEDDLARRDFTINAIAYRPRTEELRDPFDGRGDLDRRVVRAVGDAAQRMREDRLRALRAIRFAARYHFVIEPATLAAIQSSAAFLTRLSAERVQQEIVKTMEQVERPSVAFRIWRDTGALATLVPMLASLDEVGLATLDELPMATAAGRALPQRTWNRVAALFLDVAPDEARAALTALRFSRHETAWVTALVERWRARSGEMSSVLRERSPSDGEMRRWLSRLGRLYAGAVLRVGRARWRAMRRAGHVAPSDGAVRSLHKRMRQSLYRDPLEVADLLVGGDDLRRAGIRSGPVYAKILHGLLELVLADPARNTPEALMAEVPRLAAAFDGNAPQAHSHGSP